jgi:5-methylcytosine-specific restriction protein B
MMIDRRSAEGWGPAMARVAWGEPVYVAADLFRQRVMVDGQSFLWPECEAWTKENIDTALVALRQSPQQGNAAFYASMASQLEDAPDDVVRVVADAMAFFVLFFRSTWYGATRKWESVETVVAWRKSIQIPQASRTLLDAAFAQGIAESSTAFQSWRGQHLTFLIRFVRDFRQETIDSLDPDAARRVAASVMSSEGTTTALRPGLLHLLFPERFEEVVNGTDRAAILATYPDLVGQADNQDDQLRMIRLHLAEQLGNPALTLLDASIKQEWDPKNELPSKRADPTVARQLAEHLLPDAHLRRIVLQLMAGAIKAANEASAGGWNTAISFHRRSIRLNTGSNATIWIHPNDLAISVTVDETYGTSMPSESSKIIRELEATRKPFASVPKSQFVHVPFSRLEELIDVLRPACDLFAARSSAESGPRMRTWTAHASGVIDYINEELGLSLSQPSYAIPPKPDLPPIVTLATATHIATSDLEDLIDLLKDKRQIILEGPPGSGKTWLADKLARYLTGNPFDGDPDGRVELVQFHQSYGYEDFVQGIRPVTVGGQLQYRVVPGVFTRLCRTAAENPDKDFVLIIDEINRGNLSRIFGELLLLLEYRDRRVRLPYGSEADATDSDDYLRIPNNLLLIGTMNSTDRSLALIDYALRRRFYFHRLLPVVDGEAAVFRSWLEAQPSMSPQDRVRLLGLFVTLNQRIQDHLTEDFQVGHSYFMRPDIHTDAGLGRVWSRAVWPLLTEYFHGSRTGQEALAGLELGALLASITPPIPPIEREQGAPEAVAGLTIDGSQA